MRLTSTWSATFFDQDNFPGACGVIHQDSDLIGAIGEVTFFLDILQRLEKASSRRFAFYQFIDIARYGNPNAQSSLCGEQVTITNTNNGKASLMFSLTDNHVSNLILLFISKERYYYNRWRVCHLPKQQLLRSFNRRFYTNFPPRGWWSAKWAFPPQSVCIRLNWRENVQSLGNLSRRCQGQTWLRLWCITPS